MFNLKYEEAKEAAMKKKEAEKEEGKNKQRQAEVDKEKELMEEAVAAIILAQPKKKAEPKKKGVKRVIVPGTPPGVGRKGKAREADEEPNTKKNRVVETKAKESPLPLATVGTFGSAGIVLSRS